jgi:hypothetical protein
MFFTHNVISNIINIKETPRRLIPLKTKIISCNWLVSYIRCQLHYHHYLIVNIFALCRVRIYLRFTSPFSLMIHYITWSKYYCISFSLYIYVWNGFSSHNFIILATFFSHPFCVGQYNLILYFNWLPKAVMHLI